MNVLDLMNDLDDQKIRILGINFDNDNKAIVILLKIFDLKHILTAHEILKNNAKEFTANGFSLAVRYEISI
ncbi:MAG TPA: hypothetical protein VMW01_07310 [Williamwhitmania sp.]|nr:hypothetical protein [Williamwhitmania sp.]